MSAVKVKERPILFSAEMVRAILRGEKTQTRRVCRVDLQAAEWVLQQPEWTTKGGGWWTFKREIDSSHPRYGERLACNSIAVDNVQCPYGQPGERLWVREKWGVFPLRRRGEPAQTSDEIVYAATEELKPTNDQYIGMYRPSMYMPRWASRLTLEITDVRVERLQEIREADAQAEGGWSYGNCPVHKNPQRSFATLWDSINAKRGFSWDVNPWVWVVSFKRIEVPSCAK